MNRLTPAKIEKLARYIEAHATEPLPLSALAAQQASAHSTCSAASRQ